MKQHERRDLPAWWRPEYRSNAVLYACARVGMSAEEALHQLASVYAEQSRMLVDVLAKQVAPLKMVIPTEDSDDRRAKKTG